MKSLLLVLGLCFAHLPSFAVAAPTLRVVDEQGQPVARFEFMIHTANDGYSRWTKGTNGEADASELQGFQRGSQLDVLVRSDSHASTVHVFRDDELKKLRAGEATISMPNGEEVRLRLKMPDGVKLPEGLLPQLYFPEYAYRVRMFWQPENLHAGPQDFNMLNVRATENGEFLFRLPKEQREFCVAIHQPGWLRFFEVGPFTAANFRDGVLAIDVPQAMPLSARLDVGDADRSALPFSHIRYSVMWQIPGRSDAYLSAAEEVKTLDDTTFTVADLAPGTYMIQLRTSATDPTQPRAASDVNPARFGDQQMVELRPGEKSDVRMAYVPFNADAFRGDRQAEIKLLNQDGSPASGKKVKVTYFDGHYGMLKVHEGQVPEDGILRLENVTDRMPSTATIGPYAIDVNDKTLGSFRIAESDELQRFEYRIAPQVGDRAPDIAMVDVRSGKTSRLADYRGRIVFLEFWATWCGPCQPAMEKLNGLADAHRDEWKESMAVVPVSVDDSRDLVVPHVESRGWTNLQHFWSGEGKQPAFFSSPAAEAFGVNGVPTALLIDREGKILWRGHPSEMELAERVKELLRP